MATALLTRLIRPVDLTREDPTPTRLRFLLTTLSLGLQGAMRLAISVLVGQSAGPTALAQVATGLATASILSVLWPSATGAAASRFIAAAQASPDPQAVYLVTGHLNRRMVQASAVLAPIGAAYWLLIGGTLGGALTIALLTIGIGGYAFVRGVHNGARQNIRLAGWDILASGSAVLATALLIHYDVPGVLLLLPIAMAYCVVTLTGWPRTRRYPGRSTKDIDHFILWSTLGSLASAGLIHLTMLMANHRLPGHEAGIFAAAINLVAPAALLANSFSMVFFPQISAAFARADIKGASLIAIRSTEILVYVMGGSFGLLTLYSPWVVTLLWGEAFHNAAAIFPILALGPLARAVSMPAVTSMSSRGTDGVRRASAATFAGLLVAIATWFLTSFDTPWLPIAIGYSAAMTTTAASLLLQAILRNNLPIQIALLKLTIAVSCVATLLYFQSHHEWGLMTTSTVSFIALLLWSAAHSRTIHALTKMGT